MPRFEYPEHLYALLLLPVFWALWWSNAVWRRRAQKKAGDPAVVKSWLRTASSNAWVSVVLLSLTFALVAAAWAAPYRPGKPIREKTRARDVLIALDVSKSMLARDVGPDRLTAARLFIAQLAQRLEGDRVGLLLFAGRAYLQLPLTSDRSALLTLLSTVKPESVPTGGSALAEALNRAVLGFPEKVESGRIVVLISDGEDHGGGAPEAAAKAAQEGRLTIHTVGIGSPEGTTIVDPETSAPITDEKGAPVVSRLDEEGLRNLAARGGGQYVRMTAAEGASEQLAAIISGAKAGEGLGEARVEKEHLFFFALLPAFALLLLEMMPRFRRASRVPIMVSVFALVPFISSAQERQLRKGNEHYRAGRFREADEAYARALAIDSSNPRSRFNRGAALYQEKKYDAARGSLNAAATLAQDAASKGAALYNIGNTYGAEQKWKEAVDAYKQALRARPSDKDAQYNLSYAMRKLQAQQQKQNHDQKQQNQKPQKKDEQGGDEKKQQPTSSMSKDGAERILSALREEEKRVRDRENDEKRRSAPGVEKDW